MAFFFGKKKHPREGTPTSNTPNAPTPSSSTNNSLATLNSNGNSSPETKQSFMSQQQPLQQPSPPTQSVLQQNSSQLTSSTASLYPWSQRRLNLTANASPFPRYGHAANSVSSKEGDIYVIGGLIRTQQPKGDLWIVESGSNSLQTYPIVTQSDGPGPRVGHASLLVGNAFIVFGGDTKIDEKDMLDQTLYLLNTSTRHWSRVNPSQGHRPSGRYGHTLNILGSKLYVFGGQVDEQYFNDMVSFDLNTLQSTSAKWELLVPADEGSTGIPASRTNHTMVAWGDKLYLFGGTNDKTRFNDVWAFDPRNNTWTQLDCIGYIPTPREGHAAAMVGDVMYIFGGRDSDLLDLGDLAAFRIPTRRWYTFQNMGPSPTPRSGHSMTTYNGKVYVLGGEPSTPIRPQDRAAVQDELQMVYVLDTTKIRYPNDQAAQSPTDGRSNVKRIQGERGASAGSTGSPENRNGPRPRMMQGPRESVLNNAMSNSMQNPISSNDTLESQASVTSKLPRPLLSQNSTGPAGPPPAQQAPTPRINGVNPLGPRSKTPTKQDPKPKEHTSPIQSRDAGAVSERKGSQGRNVGPNGQDYQVASSPITDGAIPFQERIRQGSQTTETGTSQPVARQTNGNYQIAEEQKRPERALVDHVSSPIAEPKNEAISAELEQLRRANVWYASELALARRAGYTPQTNNGLLEDRGTDSLAETDKPLLEAMLALRSELVKVQGSVDSQAALATKKIAEVERQRDVAIAEAVYAKAKLAAVGGGSSGTPTRDSKSPDMANMDAERFGEMSRKLAAALAFQSELRSKLEHVTAEVEAERKSRQLADETATAAQNRVSELDDFRNRAASEMESLRAQLLETERESRNETANAAEATAEVQLLRVDKEELTAQLKEALEVEADLRDSLAALQTLTNTSKEKTSVLERQLEEDRQAREGLERKIVQLRNEYEEKVMYLESANNRLKNLEEVAEKYSQEAEAAHTAMEAGLKRMASRETIDITGSAAEQRVVILQEQVQAAKDLLAKTKAQADDTGERLAHAMQRVAGLELQQAQSSKDAIALRRRMADSLDELRRLRQESVEFKSKLVEKQLEVDAITTKHNALREILAERSAMAGNDKRRSRNLPSPQSGTGTPEQMNRLRELETRLEDSLRAHRETKSTAEMQAQEVEKHFREKLEQLEHDYHSAVHYVKGSEKMLQRMKEELKKYKARNLELQADLDEARRLNQGSKLDNSDWENERAALNKEIEELRGKVREAMAALDKQMREMKEQLDTLREEKDQYKLQTSQMQIQLLDVSEEVSKSRAQMERLENENALLEGRAIDAEQKVSRLLDHMESSVDAYRQNARVELNGVSGDGGSRDSYYGGGADHRTSVALDSLATELDALRSHWENTNKSYRISTAFDFDKTPTSMGEGEFSPSLAKWRQRLDEEDDSLTPREGQSPRLGKNSLAPPISH